MLKLVIFGFLLGCAAAYPGLGDTVTGIFGIGGQHIQVSVQELINYFHNVLGIQQRHDNFCTCPSILMVPYQYTPDRSSGNIVTDTLGGAVHTAQHLAGNLGF